MGLDIPLQKIPPPLKKHINGGKMCDNCAMCDLDQCSSNNSSNSVNQATDTDTNTATQVKEPSSVASEGNQCSAQVTNNVAASKSDQCSAELTNNAESMSILSPTTINAASKGKEQTQITNGAAACSQHSPSSRYRRRNTKLTSNPREVFSSNSMSESSVAESPASSLCEGEGRSLSESSQSSEDSLVVFDHDSRNHESESVSSESSSSGEEDSEDSEDSEEDSEEEMVSDAQLFSPSSEDVEKALQEKQTDTVAAVTETQKEKKGPKRAPAKVQFCPREEVFLLEDDEDARAARCGGEWEQMARDRARFRERIASMAEVINPVLDPEHRARVLQGTLAETIPQM